MKYASEVIDLLAAYPGREFRMIHIVRHIVGGRPDRAEWERVRRGVRRVLGYLEESGVVESTQPEQKSGGFAVYAWRKRDINFCKAVQEAGQYQ